LFQEMDGDGSGHVDYHEFARRWAEDRAHDDAGDAEDHANNEDGMEA
jgi:hypothetical protein